MSFLIIERGPDKGRRIPLLQFPITIGRDPNNNIVLADDEISRFHLRIKKRGKIIVVEDLDSRNGSYLNGDRMLNSIIKNGDKILIGGSEILFVTSDSKFEISEDILEFDMVVAEQIGLNGPIDINVTPESDNFKSLRINQQKLLSKVAADPVVIKSLFDCHGNVMVADDLSEAAEVLLKGIGNATKSIERAALFVWVEKYGQLIPVASRQFGKKMSFLLSHRALSDVVVRRNGIILQHNAPDVTQDGRGRAVLPMLQNERIVAIIHLESKDARTGFLEQDLAFVYALIHRSAASFEALLLRKEVDKWMVGMVETVISTVEAKDTYTRGHSDRVCRYSMAIAEEMKLDHDTKRLLMVSSLLHDVGKIGIPDSILKKASLLTSEEYEEMKLHPSIGAKIVAHLPNAARFVSGVKHHHEKWDGTGYPDGLIGEDIPFFARIVALADVFDAMVSGRSYSGFVDQSDAIERLQDEKELFDPEIFKSFTRAYENGILTIKTSTQNQLEPEKDLEDEIDYSELKQKKQ